MATFLVLAKKYIHFSFNATVFAMATPLKWPHCTSLPHSCRELQLRKSYYRQAVCNLIIMLKITSSLCVPAQYQLVVSAIFQRVKFSSNCGAFVTSLPKMTIVEFKLATCIILLSFSILRVAKIFMFSTISCMGWMPINFRNIGYLETSLTGNKSNQICCSKFFISGTFCFSFLLGYGNAC